MNNNQERAFRALANSDILVVEPNCLVEQRTILGVHGDDTDSAISLQWRDAKGCLWEAEFTEGSLKDANIEQNRLVLKDAEGEFVCISVHQLKPQLV